MKIFLTKNLLLFSGYLIVITILFRFFLSLMLQNQLFKEAWFLALIYGIFIFVIGWIYGKKDKTQLPLYDVGFRFHLVTYIICNLIAEIWYIFGFQSEYEKIKYVHLTVIIWSIFILIHFIIYLIIFKKNTIKGLKKSEIFE